MNVPLGRSDAPSQIAELHVLCRSPEQLRGVLDLGVRHVVADFCDCGAGVPPAEQGRRDACTTTSAYREAVRAAHEGGAAILLATPRIHKPGEHGFFETIHRCGADGVLAQNLAGLSYFAARGLPVVADFSLNAANELTVAWLLGQGAARVTAAYDLNRDDLLDLVAAAPPERLEVVAFGHLPMFHTEYCLWCGHVGQIASDCGRPCRRQHLKLRDRLGVEHPVLVDAGCRNTVFHAVPQCAALLVPALLARGVRAFRLELLPDYPLAQVSLIVRVFQDLIAGELGGRQAWDRLRASLPRGATRGTLRSRHTPAGGR